MAKNPNALTAPQVAVLRWIENGCPDGVYTEGWEHRIAARALERRGLVSIAGRGPTWKATMTKAGRAWLASPPPADVLPSDKEAEALVACVVAAGGSLTVEAAQGDELKTLERLVRATLHASNRPRGQKLELKGNGYYTRSVEHTVHLVPYFEDFVELQPVPVPEHVGKYHPLARRYLDERDWQYVGKDHLSRAARILHAVAVEAERRGLTVLDPCKASENQDRHQSKPLAGHLWLVGAGDRYSVEVREIAGKGGRMLDYKERFNSRQPKWMGKRQTEFISTGRLELILDGRFVPYMGQRFRDSTRSRVEDKLPDLFAGFDTYQLRAEWQAEQNRLQAEADKRRKEAAREAARQRYVEHARAAHFEHLVAAHETAERGRQFIASALHAAATLEADARTETEQYLGEMRAKLDGQDPLTSPERLLPVVATPSSDDLRAFL